MLLSYRVELHAVILQSSAVGGTLNLWIERTHHWSRLQKIKRQKRRKKKTLLTGKYFILLSGLFKSKVSLRHCVFDSACSQSRFPGWHSDGMPSPFSCIICASLATPCFPLSSRCLIFFSSHAVIIPYCVSVWSVTTHRWLELIWNALLRLMR